MLSESLAPKIIIMPKSVWLCYINMLIKRTKDKKIIEKLKLQKKNIEKI